MNDPLKTPKLQDGQFSVLLVDINTSIVLKPNGEKRLGEGEVFLTFENYLEADNFIKSKIKNNQELELALYNSNGEIVSVENRFGRNKIKLKNNWWKFW